MDKACVVNNLNSSYYHSTGDISYPGSGTENCLLLSGNDMCGCVLVSLWLACFVFVVEPILLFLMYYCVNLKSVFLNTMIVLTDLFL